MSKTGESTLLQTAIALVVVITAGVLTLLQLVVWAMATSHPGLSGDVMCSQRCLATLSTGVTLLIVIAGGFRRVLAARLWLLLALACASLASCVVLVFRDSREWDPATVLLTCLAIALLAATAWCFLTTPALPRAGQTEMRGEVGRILGLVQNAHPDVVCQQLRVAHPGVDDDGVWFFTRPGASNEVQIESSSGRCPFLIEHESSDERRTGDTPEDVADTIREWLAG